MTSTNTALYAARSLLGSYPGKLPVSQQIGESCAVEIDDFELGNDEWPQADITVVVEGVTLFFQAGVDGETDLYDSSVLNDDLHEFEGDAFSTHALTDAIENEFEESFRKFAQETMSEIKAAVQAIYTYEARQKKAM